MTTAAESQDLLREFVTSRSHDAFHRIVQLHTPLVFSAALRATRGDIHLAQDITQITFTSLAQKAGYLSRNIILSAWLYRHACHTARRHLRSDTRRRARESAAALMHTLEDAADPWPAIAPILDDAMATLSGPDRAALILRYFEKQSLRAVGHVLGLTDDAAQKRVTRALERLRLILTRRGIAVSGAAIATAIRSEATAAAIPSGLLTAVAASALAAQPATLFASLTAITTPKFILATVAVTLAIAFWLIFHTENTITSTASTSYTPPPAPARSAEPVIAPLRSSPTASAKTANSTAKSTGVPSATVPVPPATDKPVSPFPAPPARKPPAGPTPRNDPAYADAYWQHPRTKHTQARLDAVRAGIKAIINPHILRMRELDNRLKAATAAPAPADHEEATRLTAEMKLLGSQFELCQNAWEAWLGDERVGVRTSVFAEITGREQPLVFPDTLTPEEYAAHQTARTQFQNQQFDEAEAALLPLLETGPASHREQVAWQLMLSQLAQGRYEEATGTGKTLLQGSAATACLACAAGAIRNGSWDQAQIWIDNAWEKAPHPEVTALAQSLITMGWATQDSQGKPILLPPAIP